MILRLADENEINIIVLRRSAQRAERQLNICVTSVFVATKAINSQSESYNYISIYFRSKPGQTSLIAQTTVMETNPVFQRSWPAYNRKHNHDITAVDNVKEYLHKTESKLN